MLFACREYLVPFYIVEEVDLIRVIEKMCMLPFDKSSYLGMILA